MARTAPTVDGAPNRVQVSIRYIDAEGDRRADAFDVPADVTAAEIEALVAAIAANSNANIWQVQVSEVYGTTQNLASAVAGDVASVNANICFTFKEIDGRAVRFFLPAPERAVFVGDTDAVDTAGAPFSTLVAAMSSVMANTLGETWGLQSVRYTERREKNKAQIV